MRTKVISTNTNLAPYTPGRIQERYQAVSEMTDRLADMLALFGLKSMTLEFPGRVITYSAIQYDCDCCGSYNHRFEDCPEFEVDDS